MVRRVGMTGLDTIWTVELGPPHLSVINLPGDTVHSLEQQPQVKVHRGSLRGTNTFPSCPVTHNKTQAFNHNYDQS